MPFFLHQSRFKFVLAVGRRRAIVASYVPSSPEGCQEAQTIKARLSRSICESIKGELATASQRIHCARLRVGFHLACGEAAVVGVWQGFDQEARLRILAEVYHLWLEEHNVALLEDASCHECDMLLFHTVGDLLPRTSPGSRGEAWDAMADIKGMGLIGERLAESPEHLQSFLKAVAEGSDNEKTGRPAFELRRAALQYALEYAVTNKFIDSWFWHDVNTAPEDRIRKELEIVTSMRALYLATYAMSLCDTLGSLLLLKPGLQVKIVGLQKRRDLNGCTGQVDGRSPKAAGKDLRWSVKVGNETVAVKLRNIVTNDR